MSMLTATVNIPKTTGHALVVGTAADMADPHDVLTGLGYEVDRREDPYAAMLELCRRPLVYRAVVLSLQGLYRDELAMISTVRRRFPHVNIYLSDTDGRQAALAEAMRLGAEGLVDGNGLHSLADVPTPALTPRPTQFRPAPSQANAHERHEPAIDRSDHSTKASHVAPPTEPVLTADELRALLSDDL